MSWLDEINEERIYNYLFTDEEAGVAFGTLKQLSELTGTEVKGEPNEILDIEGRKAKYAGFEPFQLKQEARFEYEKNGRKAVHIIDKDGNHKYVSQSRMLYNKTGRADGVYSKAYEEHLKKTQQEHLIKEDRQHKLASAALMKAADVPEEKKK